MSTLHASTTNAVKALVCVPCGAGSNHTNAQMGMCRLATGVANSEVEFARWPIELGTSTGTVPRGHSSIIEVSLAAGVRISARVSVSVGLGAPDNCRIGILGFR